MTTCQQRSLADICVRMSSEFDNLKKAVESGVRLIDISGLTSISAKAYILARLHHETGQRIVVVSENNVTAETWASDISFLLNAEFLISTTSIVTLPAFETDPYSGLSPHAMTMERRALALWSIANGSADIITISARSLVQRTISPVEVASLGTEIILNMDTPLDRLIEKLIATGYVREEPIFGPGQFSIRGGILDVWSPDADAPARVEFFGDTVDSIRSFDADTQLSTGHLRSLSIAPMREFSISPKDLEEWAFFAGEEFTDIKFQRNLKDRTDFAKEGETFPGWEFALPLVRPLMSTALDHFGDAIIVIDEPTLVEHVIADICENTAHAYAGIIESGEIGLPPETYFVTPDDLRNRLNERQRIEIRSLGRTAAASDEEFSLAASDDLPGETRLTSRGVIKPIFLFTTAEKAIEIEMPSRSTRKFHGDVAGFANDIRSRTQPRIVSQTHGIGERINELLQDYEVTAPSGMIVSGSLSAGFEIPAEGVSMFTEIDIFGESSGDRAETQDRTSKSKRSKLGAFISDFRDLKPGDYVVHVDHGIGRFEGLQSISSQGDEREFMLLIYADNSKLFVPVERMDLVSRYSSGESTTPSLDRLGGLGWQKTKARAKRAMRDMADELLKLYAERKLVRGYAFPPDAPWQHEFEEAFPYDLTVDQATAISDIKNDMESSIPMDRLIIGDVGYGKTEVAMRATFKAVMDGRQAAVLTPTTVLAYQHYETFKKRFAAFPVKIELLSRFRSTKEQKAVVEAVEKGDVDVLVGTHRILSTDVKLSKLGLVVIDEEQRFGVGHKEKLKQLKKKVDVLTLSATPIPRTLNMSLIGMRDMSVIETPPRDRLAINTQVVQFNENVIRSAIEVELARGGQIFFIHNRVESIESIAALIKKIVPDARVAIGHGQMNEKEMEQVMLDFMDHKFDVLVATTIIENGIDIPRANTIIINRADNYGLSQLYQLRGRVGRSNRRAYAYLLIPSELELTPIARRRLSAIREFSDLGAGFRLAALDLELRGAGNILGGQQSGNLDALGFDLYTKMLERTIGELRGDEIADEVSVSINLGIDVSIPKDYISDAGQRLRTYKRISSAESDAALEQIDLEIRDRYGRLPRQVENLFEYGRLRKLAERLYLISIDRSAGGIAIKLGEQARIDPDKLMSMLETREGTSFSPNGILRFPLEPGDNPIIEARRVLDSIQS